MCRNGLAVCALASLLVVAVGCGSDAKSAKEDSKAVLTEAIALVEADKFEEMFSKCCCKYFIDRIKKQGMYDKVVEVTKKNKAELLRLLKDSESTNPDFVKVIEGDGLWAKYPVGTDTIELCKPNGKFGLVPRWEFISQMYLNQDKEMPNPLPTED